MKSVVRITVVVFALVLVISGSVVSGKSVRSFDVVGNIANEIGESLVREEDITAATIAVLHGDEIIHAQQFGYSDIAQNRKVDGETQFNIGSVSKIFTATAILLLQQDGILDIDDKVVDHLPNFSMKDENYSDITIRMLLNHTSGLPGTNMNRGFTAKRYPPYIEDTMRLLKDSHLKHAPGAFSSYCNDGFSVAQALLEKVTGESYQTFVRERIFIPARMPHTSVGFVSENIAHPYANGMVRLPEEYVNIVASGGLSSSAEDLCHYARMLFTTDLLSHDSLYEFFSEQKPEYCVDMEFPRYHTFGLGWDFTSREVYRRSGLQVLGKSGGTTQYSAILLVVPEVECAVSLICNGLVDPFVTAQPILDTLLSEIGVERNENEPIVEPKEEPIPDHFKRYVGYYGSGNALHRIGFDWESSSLVISTWNVDAFSDAVAADHIGDGLFRDKEEKTYALRTLLGVPSVLKVHYPYRSEEIMMTRLPVVDPVEDHHFSESFWVPTNFHPDDVFLRLFRTSCIPELPSYIILESDSVVPYAIVDADSTRMVLPAVRDQTPPRSDAEGNLRVGSYRCRDLSSIAELDTCETIMVVGVSSTEWRTFHGMGEIICDVPENGRIVVLDEGLNLITDTLIHTKQKPLKLAIRNGYVAFIADGMTLFKPQFKLLE